MKIKTQRLLSLGLSLLNAVGVVGTFIFVAKETPKYQKAKEELPEDADKKTKIKTFIKNYKGSLIFAGASIISGMSSRVISAKTEASLIASAAMLDSSLRKYKGKIKETLGIDADKSIVKEIMKDEYKKPTEKCNENEKLYYESHIGYFYAVPEKVKDAYIKINSEFCDMGTVPYDGGFRTGVFTLGEFLESCKGRPLSHNLNSEKLNFGWSIDYLYEQHEGSWVHIDLSEPDENNAILIYWFEEPIWNPAEWSDYIYGLISEEEYFNGSEEIDIPNRNSQYYKKFNNNIL